MTSLNIKILPTPENIIWTQHSHFKLKQYQLSKSRILRIIRHPERTESGIAPQTLAAMQRVGHKQPSEIWVMWQNITINQFNKKIKIISTWRYPGISPINQPPPIPDDVLEIIREQI